MFVCLCVCVCARMYTKYERTCIHTPTCVCMYVCVICLIYVFKVSLCSLKSTLKYVISLPCPSMFNQWLLLHVYFPVDVMKQIDIPSVFISEETANSLKEDYSYDKG